MTYMGQDIIKKKDLSNWQNRLLSITEQPCDKDDRTVHWYWSKKEGSERPLLRNTLNGIMVLL